MVVVTKKEEHEIMAKIILGLLSTASRVAQDTTTCQVYLILLWDFPRSHCFVHHVSMKGRADMKVIYIFSDIKVWRTDSEINNNGQIRIWNLFWEEGEKYGFNPLGDNTNIFWHNSYHKVLSAWNGEWLRWRTSVIGLLVGRVEGSGWPFEGGRRMKL